MPELIDCTNNAIPIDTLLKDLFAENATNIVFLKYRVVAANTDNPIDCGTYEEFINLLKQALDLTNNVVSLRVMITNNTDAANTTRVPRCGQAQAWWETFKYSFYLSAAGEVALNLMNVT